MADPPAAVPAPTTAVPPLIAAPVKLPAFQPGLWEYRRTMMGAESGKPQTATVNKCSDPSGDIQQKLTELKQRGCQFTPLTQNGNQYRSSWICSVTGGTLTVQDVITVRSATSYQDDNEVRHPSQTLRSTIVASRLGDCPPGEKPAPTAPKWPRDMPADSTSAILRGR